MEERVVVASHMIIWAFRYSLGRMSTCPSMVQDELRLVWETLPEQTRDCIQSELAHAIKAHSNGHRTLGMDCDAAGWLQFNEWVFERQCLMKNTESLKRFSDEYKGEEPA